MQIIRNFIFVCSFMGLRIAEERKRPHIVFMIVDDLGWNDVSFHGSIQIPTPNIDVIARDGIILNNYYTIHMCSPSRGALMTGKYPIRIGFQHRVIVADAPWGLPLQEKILPQYLKSIGYSTRAVGKWHLGFFNEEYLPLNRGFDSFFGYYSGVEDYYTHFATSLSNLTGLDLHDNFENAWSYEGVYGTELYTEKAKDVILNHNTSEPLFLYFSQQAPHSGNFNNALQVPDKYVEPLEGIEDEERRKFAGMVSAMDYSVGEIFEALEEASMLDDTLFIFTTDNGGAVEGADSTRGSNFPLRGSKYTLWEGGVRGVAFMWSQQLRQHSRVYNDLMFLTDWLPTLLSAADSADVAQDIDGYSVWSSLLSNSSSQRNEILLNIDRLSHVEGIRWKNYKLVNGSYFDGFFDGWYDENGTLFNESRSPAQSLEVYRKTYLELLEQSKAARILQDKYNKTPCSPISEDLTSCPRIPFAVCDESPPSPQDRCDPNLGACLFDIEKDPCEFHNIAELHPEIVEKLATQIRKYDAVEVPPLYVPLDPAADPKLHGMAWVPWR
ncbi:arylsulfatase B isoform X1 [Parasteatoda tepidariorum]|uniref:arylsulfatase B isoform X2 n=1 Tax=Parasteatoda tepidariorum TaxID=114398 RepID=UPI001C71A4D3|nr:arylsulfatase B isoform X1 [Parasteatoda tepidariorum]XP_042899116.1 arylsulfatase B isoform X1 [Parasteatoda tepidariorum]XP_042899117.1 arylsulfatase B isoform X2 [Parasteatoda tepidariorum]